MTATTTLGALLVAVVASFLAAITGAFGWAAPTVALAGVALFFITLALTYVVPAAAAERLEQENSR